MQRTHHRTELWLGFVFTLFSRPRRQAKYGGCSENHGIRPPAPEQYLTPLQQKEVCIRHLRARLKENVERLQDRSVAERNLLPDLLPCEPVLPSAFTTLKIEKFVLFRNVKVVGSFIPTYSAYI